ncbi:MAG: hypothetical protein U1A27_01035 [Phycisphaerae bacterium]
MSRTACLVALLACSAADLRAAPCVGLRTSGAIVRVCDTTMHDRYSARVAFSPASLRYLVVWSEYVGSATGADILYRFVDDSATPQGLPAPLVTKVNAQSDPDVAWDGTGNQFLAVWSSQEAVIGCYGRTVTGAGTLGASDFLIHTGGVDPRVAYGTSGDRYLVTVRGAGCTGRRVDPAGAPDGSSFSINTAGVVAPNGDVAYDSNNSRFLAVWRDQAANANNVQGRLVKSNGTFMGSQFIVANTFPSAMAVAYNPSAANFLVVFDTFDNTGLRAQLVTGGGTPLGNTVHITDDDVAAPRVAYDPHRELYVVVGQQSGSIVAYAVTADGVVAVDRVVVAQGTDGVLPDVAYNSAADECLVVWRDQTGGSASRVACRRLTFGAGSLECTVAACGSSLCGVGFGPVVGVALVGLMAWRRVGRLDRGNSRRRSSTA